MRALIVIFLLLLAQPVWAQEGYVRLVRDSQNVPKSLETAIARFVSTEGQIVDLVAVIHVGEASYYERLNKHFGNYQSLLYEMVLDVPKSVSHQNDVRELLGREKTEPKIDTSKGGRDSLSLFQQKLAELLGLEFQLEHIHYDRENFRHADLTKQEFDAAMVGKEQSPLAMLKSFFKSESKTLPPEYRAISNLPLLKILAQGPTPQEQSVLRVGVAALLAGPDQGMSEMQGEVVILRRNEKAMEVLAQRLKKGEKPLAIFYGAAHMPDFSHRLRAQGFKPVSRTWVKAWTL